MFLLGKVVSLAAGYAAIKYGSKLVKKYRNSKDEPADWSKEAYRRSSADNECNDDRLNTIRKHWSSTAVMTDDYTSKTKVRKVAKEDLLPGELSAETFRVGNYMVRCAQRVYDENLQNPANKTDVERCKTSSDTIGGFLETPPEDLRVVQEISARIYGSTEEGFTVICRAQYARSWHWCESIDTICTIKENEIASDKRASLFVLNTYIGDSFSVDTWYKFDPNGKISKLSLHPYNSDIDNERFQDVEAEENAE